MPSSSGASKPDPTFFASAAQFRRWLEKNHSSATELWVGFYKASTGKNTFTYKQALDEALCFGWIDGVRKSLDAESYVQRFTPRRRRSYWSAVNTKRVHELQAAGLMHTAGLEAFARRDAAATARYSFERERPVFDPAQEKQFRSNRTAWTYFESEAPWYQRVATHWVTSAKKPETRQRRLEMLISDCARGQRIAAVPQKKKSAG